MDKEDVKRVHFARGEGGGRCPRKDERSENENFLKRGKKLEIRAKCTTKKKAGGASHPLHLKKKVGSPLDKKRYERSEYANKKLGQIANKNADLKIKAQSVITVCANGRKPLITQFLDLTQKENFVK